MADDSDALPSQSDTPPDHTVIALSIDSELLPEWFDAVRDIAGGLARRMVVVEAPEAWFAKVELHDERVDTFRDHLAAAWETFVAQRKAEGRWH